MIGINQKNNKANNTVIIHYLTSGIFFFIASCLILLYHESLVGHYFHPKLLSITHFTTLGWISLIIIGSLYQLAPVISDSELYSVKMANASFLLIITGTILLSIAFFLFDIGILIQIASILLLIGISIFTINLYITINRGKEKNIESDFVSASSLWFWLTAFIGALLAFNFRYSFLPKEHLHYLKIHAHIGLIGWFMCLIIGISSKLIPMFLISGKQSSKGLQYAFYLLNIGLLSYIIDSVFFQNELRTILYIIPVILSIIIFISYVYKSYKSRLKKKLDIGMKHTVISVLLIIIPIVLWLTVKSNLIHDTKLKLQLSLAIGFSILFGFITLLILGQALKNLVFIAWLKKYQNHSNKSTAPLPKDMYSEKIAKIQLYIYFAAFSFLLIGIICSKNNLLLIGSALLIIVSILHNVNLYNIVFHTKKEIK